MTAPRLKLASPGDARSVLDLQAASVRDLAGAHYSPRQIEAFLAEAAAQIEELLRSTQLWVAVEADRRLVACAGWRPDGGAEAVVRAVYTRPGWTRRGLAGRLLDRVEAEASLAGMQRIRLLAMRGSESFYSARGYDAAGEGGLVLDGVPFPGRSMVKTLGTPSLTEAAA